MTLDLIIPTYNRHQLLRSALESVLRAHIPAGMKVSVIVVDNNSSDATPEVVAAFIKPFSGRLKSLHESRQGRSQALNAGIQASAADLIGCIDDDEEIDADWFKVVRQAFDDPQIQFVGGPYIPQWESPAPPWIPPEYSGVLGIIDGGPHPFIFDQNYHGILMGGNAAYRRHVFEKVGLFDTALGHKGSRLTAEEDNDMYERLLAAGVKGMYLPNLVIYHKIPPARLTKRYFRRWCFWNGVSRSVLGRRRPEPVAHIFGIPRYLIGDAIRGLGSFFSSAPPARRFSQELALWGLFGFVYGRVNRNAGT